MKEEPTTQDCIDFINNTKHWNGGLGLIVPHRVAEELRKMGITEGYTEQVDMPTSNHL